MIRKVLLVGGIGAALCLAYPIAGTLTAQTIGDAGEACADEELGGVHSEPFTDASREGEGSFVSGWGSGGITLTRRGSAFDISTQTVGLRLTGIASGDFNGDGWVDVVGATDRPDCHLHFMENKGNDPMTGEHLGFTNGEDEGRFDDHRLGACYNFTCAHVASGDFDGDGDPDMFYAHMNCRGGGRALRTFIYENTGVVDGVPQWSVHERDQDIFHDGRITTYKNYMPFKGYDWDDDGRDDIVAVAGWDNTSELQLYRARDDELGFQSKIILIPDLEARAPMANDTQRPNTNCTGRSHGPSAFGIADFDGDDNLDIVFGSVASDFLTYWRGTDSDNFTKVNYTIGYTPGSTTFMNAADMDGDGDADLVMGRDGYSCGGKAGLVFLYVNDGSGNFSEATRRTIIDYKDDYDSGLVFDFNNDGQPDVLASDGNNIGEYAVGLNGTGNVFNLEGEAYSKSDLGLVGDGEVLTSILVTSFIADCADGTTDCDPYDKITLFVSNDGGDSWEQLEEDELPNASGQNRHSFSSFGSEFRWRAVFQEQEDLLTGEDAQYAPASKDSPRLKNLEFQTYKTEERTFSRSSPAIGTLVDSDGEVRNYLFSAFFKYPGYQAELVALDVTDVRDGTGGGVNSDVAVTSSVDTVEPVWFSDPSIGAGQLLRTRNPNNRVIYSAYDAQSDGDVDDCINFGNSTSTHCATADTEKMAELLGITEEETDNFIEFIRAGFASYDDHDFKFFNPGHSSPVFSGPPVDTNDVRRLVTANGPAFGDFDSDAGNTASYRYFLENTLGSRPVVFIGANDGMVHAFDARSGEELWGFIPHNLLSRLKDTRRVDGTGQTVWQPQFLVDGPLSLQDVQLDGVWRRVLISGQALGMGRLSRNYYFALDVTDPLEPEPIWEFTDGANSTINACNPVQGAVTTCVPETCPQGSCSDSCTEEDAISINVPSVGIIIEAENFNTQSEFTVGEGWETRSDSEASGGQYVVNPEIAVETSPCDPGDCGGVLSYNIEADVAGTYYLWARTRSDLGATGTLGDNNSIWVGTDVVVAPSAAYELSTSDEFEWSSLVQTVELVQGDNILYVYTHEMGTAVDKLLLTFDSSTPDDDDVGAQVCLLQCAPPPPCVQDCTPTYIDISQPWPWCPANEFCCDTGGDEFACASDCSDISIDQTLGETWSKPVIGKVNLSGGGVWLAFFGSGYNNLDQSTLTVGRSVYAVSIEDARILERWDFDDIASDSDNPSTIENVVAAGVSLADMDDDGFVDRAYFADLEGRLWRVDTSPQGSESSMRPSGEVAAWPETSAPWDACPLFDAGQPSGVNDSAGDARTWAPIITRPAVALLDEHTDSGQSIFPLVFFGTGGDDRAPDDLNYKFYAVRDDLANCNAPTKAERDLEIGNGEWVIGDGLERDMQTALDDPTVEGTEGQRYWTDPVIANGDVVYFASVFGDIESIDPCESLGGSDTTRLYGIAIRSFQTQRGRIETGQTALSSGDLFAAMPTKLRTAAAVTKSDTTPIGRNAGDAPEDQDVFLQGFSGDQVAETFVVTEVSEVANPVTSLKVLSWREVSLP